MSEQYDIIIVGAGLVGCSLAVALQPLNCRIAILEKFLPEAKAPQNIDSRPLTLTNGSKNILQNLNIWSQLSEYCAIQKVHVSQQGRLGFTRFNAEEQSVPALGFVVSYDELHLKLYEAALSSKNVDVITVSDINNIHCDHKGARIVYQSADSEHELFSQLLVAADGTQSTCRELLNIQAPIKAHDEIAWIATLELAEPHERVAFERFTARGTLGVLPLPNEKYCRLVWTLPVELAEALNNKTDADILDDLQNIFDDRLGKLVSLKRNAQFPLQSRIAKEQVRPGFVLIGNAAHTIYPIAAQGFNLGLRDAVDLAKVLKHAVQKEINFADLSLLKEYAQRREVDQKRTVRVTQGVAAVFDLQVPGVNHLRGLGLLALDMLQPLKKRFARKMMGQ